MRWSKERVELLTGLWNEGKSTSAIARVLDTTRGPEEKAFNKNMVVGKAHRLGLKGRPSPIKKKKRVHQPFKRDGCQWPTGDPGASNFSLCGAPVHKDKPYCEDHCEMAYRKKADSEGGKANEKEDATSYHRYGGVVR